MGHKIIMIVTYHLQYGWFQKIAQRNWMYGDRSLDVMIGSDMDFFGGKNNKCVHMLRYIYIS